MLPLRRVVLFLAFGLSSAQAFASPDAGELFSELSRCRASSFLDLPSQELCPDCVQVARFKDAGREWLQVAVFADVMGANAIHSSRHCIIDPATCRAVWLEISEAIDEAEMASLPEAPPPSEAEQAALLKSMKLARLAPRDGRDQLAQQEIPSLFRPPADGVPATPIAVASPRVTARCAPSKPQAQRDSSRALPGYSARDSVESGPTYRVFYGSAFKPVEQVKVAGKVLHVFRKGARRFMDAFALYDPAKDRTCWSGKTLGPSQVVGVFHGYVWVKLGPGNDTSYELVAIDLGTGDSRHVGFEPDHTFRVESVDAEGLHLGNEGQPGPVLPWAQVLPVLKAK